MAEPETFGTVTFLGAEAVGQPGQRRFRIKVMNDEGRTASLWLEKESLTALGDAIETVLKDESFEQRRPSTPSTPSDDPVFPWRCDLDFRVGQLSMGVYREQRQLVFMAAEVVAEGDESGAALQVAVDFGRGIDFRQQILRVVAAGRPPCPLCGGPLDPSGHVCPRQNGHHKQD